MRLSRVLAAMAVCALAVLGPAAAATATDPVTLGTGYVQDQVGALTDDQADAAETQLSDLYHATGIDLYVVFVDKFTNPTDRQEWADQVADDNGLGDTQYLLAVAVDGRQFTISGLDSGPVNEAQLDQIESEIKPALSHHDYAGAITAAANGFGSAVNRSGGGFLGVIVVLVIVIVLAALAAWFVWRSRRRRRAPAPAGGPALGDLDATQLARRASSALVATDDAVRTSDQELGFARAQFGDDATREFAAALTHARSALNEAFGLRQKLDDAEPDTQEQIRAWNTRIIELCDQADHDLDQKASAFDELRRLEQNAPEALIRVQQQRTQVTAGVDAAAGRLATLLRGYAPTALATIVDNVDQSKARLDFADEQLRDAQQSIGAGSGGHAAVSIRAAEQAVDQAKLLQDSIDSLGTDLAAAKDRAAALIAELEGDIAAAAAVPDPDGQVATAAAATRARVDAAHRALAGDLPDPLAVVADLQAGNAQIDAVLQSARDAEQNARRTGVLLHQTLAQAQAQVSTAEDYIVSRRGAVGADARTRLAQAGAELVRARGLAPSDPVQSLAHAQRASELADQAGRLAQQDVGGFGGLPGRSNGSSMGAILGGIIVGSLLSGGTRRGGFGGPAGRPAGSPGTHSIPTVPSGTRSHRGGGRF